MDKRTFGEDIYSSRKNDMGWVKTLLLAIAVLVLGGAWDFWRGYHKWHSIAAGFFYAIFGWILFGVPIIFIFWIFNRKSEEPSDSELRLPKS